MLDHKAFFQQTAGMSIALDALESRIDQLLSVCASLRTENEALRVRVVGLESDKQSLQHKIDATATRLEALMERLPEE
jgi:cell division protein ZapB